MATKLILWPAQVASDQRLLTPKMPMAQRPSQLCHYPFNNQNYLELQIPSCSTCSSPGYGFLSCKPDLYWLLDFSMMTPLDYKYDEGSVQELGLINNYNTSQGLDLEMLRPSFLNFVAGFSSVNVADQIVEMKKKSQQKQESSEKDDFYANMGSAIRTLREEMPLLFYKDLNYDIYREDIVFRDRQNTFSGINNYKILFWSLRFHGQIFFKAIWVEVLRIWQPSQRVIVVRWSVRGIPRVPWKAQGFFEGVSEYKLDDVGKIYEHRIDNVAINYPPILRDITMLRSLYPSRCVYPTPT